MLDHHLPELGLFLDFGLKSFFDHNMYLVWFQWYEEAYLTVGGFRKVVPEG